MPSTTTSWLRNVIFKVCNINLQLTNGKPLSFTTLSQPYVHWCPWIKPLSLIQSNQKKKFCTIRLLGFWHLNFHHGWVHLGHSHYLSHYLFCKPSPSPTTPTPPQIDEYSRCAYVVHSVSSATKGPMHVTFKALFCTMEHTRYVHHTRSSVLELNSSLFRVGEA